MKTSIINKLAKTFAALLIVATLASCAKKGTGCPSDFKAPKISINIK